MVLRNLIFFSLFLPVTLTAQQSESGVPYSTVFGLNKLSSYESLAIISSQTKLVKSQSISNRKSLEFAYVHELDFSPESSGIWNTLEDGSKAWRLGLVSKGAFSLNVIFTRFQLLAGVKIYIYSPDQKNILGAFSSKNNSISEILATQPVPGDSIIIELNIPAGIEDFGELAIGKLGHDYVDILGTNRTKFSIGGQSGACNVDINCESGNDWQREKYAICKLIIGGKELCTGTLLNNTANDKTPYIITANHCIDTTIKAASTVFIFDYEKWRCGGVGGTLTKSVSGSQLVATTPHLDFSLVKLSGLPNFNYKPYFAGWDRSKNTPVRTASIHHPNGDFKKISLDNNSPGDSSFVDNSLPIQYNSNTHWLIRKWEVGTTERGSSGAPLFDQNHRFIGDLSGGDASCILSVNDFFAKFSNSWADYSEWPRQLKHWLDPNNTNEMAINGLDPYEGEKSSCDTIFNISSTENRRLYTNNLSWGYVSGQNSNLYTQFAEKMDIGGTLKISGFYLHVAKAYNASPLSYITIKLWKGGTVPGSEISSRTFYMKDLVAESENFLEFDSVIFTSGPVFLGYSVNYSATQDTFAVYQAENRGSLGNSGMYVYKDNSWKNVLEISSPALFSSLAIGLISCGAINKVKIAEIKPLKVYPNPVSSGMLFVEMPEGELKNLAVYDIMGRQIPASYQKNDNKLQIDIERLTTGIYFITVGVSGNQVYSAKFSVIK